MPQNKNQHFVPQFYLRRFAATGSGKCINVYVIPSERFIDCASIRNQASESYFYGQGDEGYINFRKLEFEASGIIEDVIETGPPLYGSPAHWTLTIFMHLLHSRTQYAANKYNEFIDKTMKAVAAMDQRAGNSLPKGVEFSYTDPITRSLMQARDTWFYLLDLHMRVLENLTSAPFVCSDNPVVLYNRFLETRARRGGTTGLATKGLQLFCPLSPRHCFLYFDPFVYKIGGRNRGFVQICDRSDILQINRLQYLSADSCIYYGDGMTPGGIRELAGSSLRHRRRTKVEVKRAKVVMPDGSIGDLLVTQQSEIKCGLSLSFVKLQRRARRYRVGPQVWHPRSQALADIARADWETRQPGRQTSGGPPLGGS